MLPEMFRSPEDPDTWVMIQYHYYHYLVDSSCSALLCYNHTLELIHEPLPSTQISVRKGLPLLCWQQLLNNRGIIVEDEELLSGTLMFVVIH